MSKLHKPITALFILLSLLFYAPLAAAEPYAERRQQLINLITNEVALTSSYLGAKTLNPNVMQAMADVPRHKFVPEDQLPFAYENRPLPIGRGQTISQPYIVAVMTELLNPDPKDKILELGTGSGYQAAILSELADQVYSVEIIRFLGDQAADRLDRLGYKNVHVKIGDGYYGWKEHGPYDGIVVTAAGSYIPPPLIKQLKPGGRMIIPVGSRFMTQQLLLVTKEQDDKIVTRQILPVRFVPLTGNHN